MFALMLAVFAEWSQESRAHGGLGWLESARRANFATITAARSGAAAAGLAPETGSVDDDEHLAAYNAYLRRLNKHP
jgi:hypothetical protein